MWTYPFQYDVIVVGAGHAGCEAAYASAKMGVSTLLLTLHLDHIGKMSCNPSIGGIAKGHIVREIDALGGIMGKISDDTGIHYRMLNASKGPAVRSPRAQIDKATYSKNIKYFLENTKNLDIRQAKIEKLLCDKDQIKGVVTQDGIIFLSKTVILTTGTFMKGAIFIGDAKYEGGRSGEEACNSISLSLNELGFSLDKLKTGTPPRINANSIDFSLVEVQKGEDNVFFSYDKKDQNYKLKQVNCFITYTNDNTSRIVKNNIHRSALFLGKIQGVGPRYCPSIEDKIVRFPHRERHQIFLEPEGLDTNEIYVNGLSSSLPIEVQEQFITSIPALRHAKIMRPAYAIEYDYIISGQIDTYLETKKIKGLFFAGQINGTTGYEEAAAQGLIAGINAVNSILNKPKFSLTRQESYIGVMLTDITTKELDEPYRMFTSRAEHRLILRQDNADLRLREYGYHLGLISKEQYEKVKHKKDCINEALEKLKKTKVSFLAKHVSLFQLLSRPEISYKQLLLDFENHIVDFGREINEQIEIEIKYEGYIKRQRKEAQKWNRLEKIVVPQSFSFSLIKGLKAEAKEKLIKFSPKNLENASRIDGVSPADISILMVALEKASFG